MERGKLQIRSLSVKLEKPLEGRIEAELENHSKSDIPASVLLIYFYDSGGLVQDRVSVRMPPVKPLEKRKISSFYRLKNNRFFSYSAELKMTES